MRLRCVKYAATRPLCTNRYQFIINPRLANARVCASAAEPAANGASPQQVQPLQAPIPSGNIGPLDNLVKSTPMPRSNSSKVLQETWQRHLRRPYQLRPEFHTNVRLRLQAEYAAQTASLPIFQRIQHWWEAQGYKYFIWRKDAFNDLQVFASINLAIVLVGGVLKRVVENVVTDDAEATGQLLQNTYQVGVLMFGNSFPDNASNALEQGFSLLIAALGIASFAISLALVEQVVLENLESNVRRGSKVYEKGHLVVLMWGTSQRDVEVTQTILQQACVAFAAQSGKAVVVLSNRPKVEMEEFFMSAVPYDDRQGTQFVFRQGSPLDAQDLTNIAAQDAYAVVVVSDCSRAPDEADAQTIRCAVLLDELGYPGPGVVDTRQAIIIAELKTLDALPLLQFSCSPRVVGFPTNLTNARSFCRMVHNPITAFITRVLWDFEAQAQVHIEAFPQLVGVPFAELPFHFPDGVVVGILRGGYGRLWISPPGDVRLGPHDDIMVCRPSVRGGSGKYVPLEKPVAVDIGDWDPLAFYQPPPPSNVLTMETTAPVYVRSDEYLTSRDDATTGSFDMTVPCAFPPGYFDHTSSTKGLLVCGWSEPSLMSDMLRELDRGPSRLETGSLLTLYNEHSWQEVQAVCRAAGVRNLRIDHKQADPCDHARLEASLDISLYRCAIVLCDINWLDPDGVTTNGVEMHRSHDMMRMDSIILSIQLTLRRMLSQHSLPEINIICERMSKAVHLTRFEDQVRMPMGISINVATYSAKLLMQVAYNPQVMFPLFQFGRMHAIEIRDVACLAYQGERASWWQLMARALAVNSILVGYYDIPVTEEQPLKMVINPVGNEERSRQRTWNNGSGRRKLLMVCVRANPMDDVSSDDDASSTVRPASSSTASSAGEKAPSMQRTASEAVETVTTELRPEFEGEDVQRQLQRFSQFTMTRTLGRSESRRRMRV